MGFGNHDYTTMYRDAVAAYAARTIAAVAGSLKRAGHLDEKALASCENLMTALEVAAEHSPRGGAVEDAAVIRAFYSNPQGS